MNERTIPRTNEFKHNLLIGLDAQLLVGLLVGYIYRRRPLMGIQNSVPRLMRMHLARSGRVDLGGTDTKKEKTMLLSS
jgi:hypothetical protein